MKHTVFIMCVLFAICCSGCGTKTEVPEESVDMETTKATEGVDTGMAMKIETPEGDIIVEVTKDTEATETTEPLWKLTTKMVLE